MLTRDLEVTTTPQGLMASLSLMSGGTYLVECKGVNTIRLARLTATPATPGSGPYHDLARGERMPIGLSRLVGLDPRGPGNGLPSGPFTRRDDGGKITSGPGLCCRWEDRQTSPTVLVLTLRAAGIGSSQPGLLRGREAVDVSHTSEDYRGDAKGRFYESGFVLQVGGSGNVTYRTQLGTADGTIVEHCFPGIGPPIPDALRVLRRLNSEGEPEVRLILYTMRSGRYLDEAVRYLKDNNITLWAVNENPGQSSWTSSPKIHADLCIDDRNLGVPTYVNPPDLLDWKKIERILEKRGILPFYIRGHRHPTSWR